MDDNGDDNYDDDDGYEDDDNNDGDDTDVGRCWEDWLPSSCCLLIAGCRRHTTYSICISVFLVISVFLYARLV